MGPAMLWYLAVCMCLLAVLSPVYVLVTLSPYGRNFETRWVLCGCCVMTTWASWSTISLFGSAWVEVML